MKQAGADQAVGPWLGQRRFWSAEQKRRMVAESLAPGASASKVAQRYGVDADLLFTWRRQQGMSEAVGVLEPIQLLPVTVADAGTAAAQAAPQSRVGGMEIVLNSGERIVVVADVDASSLACGQGAFAPMIPMPAGVRVWLATGGADMGKGSTALR
jgi:transposase